MTATSLLQNGQPADMLDILVAMLNNNRKFDYHF